MNGNIPTTPPRASIDTGAYRSGAMRHGSVSSYNTASPARPTTSGGASFTKPPSKSLGRISSFAASFRTSQSSNSTSDLHSSDKGGLKNSSSSDMTEHDRLTRELHQWQLTEERMEDLVDQAAQFQPGSGPEDLSNVTIKSKGTPRTSGQQAYKVPGSPPQQTSLTSDATSSPIFVSGSLPSPQKGLRPSKDFGVSQASHTGNEDNFRAANNSRSGSSDTEGGSSTATNATSRQQNSQLPQAREEPCLTSSLAALQEGTTPRPGALTNPNPSSFWLDSSSSSATEQDVNERPSPSLNSEHDAGEACSALPETDKGTATAKEQPIVSPSSGRHIRKRAPSSSITVVGDTPGMRIISSGSTESGTSAAADTGDEAETQNAGLGLGLGLARDHSAPDSAIPPVQQMDSFSTPPQSRPSPQLVTVPRLTTQSPSPAHAQILTKVSSPISTPSRQIVSSGSVNMYPVGSSSPRAGNGHIRSLPQKRSSSGLQTPVLGLPEGEASSSVQSSPVQPSPSATNGGTLPSSVIDRARVFADRCWKEDESFLKKEKIAEWLGGTGELNQYALKFYMQNLDLAGLRLDNAFRYAMIVT